MPFEQAENQAEGSIKYFKIDESRFGTTKNEKGEVVDVQSYASPVDGRTHGFMDEGYVGSPNGLIFEVRQDLPGDGLFMDSKPPKPVQGTEHKVKIFASSQELLLEFLKKNGLEQYYK